jgi:hypothetical protein
MKQHENNYVVKPYRQIWLWLLLWMVFVPGVRAEGIITTVVNDKEDSGENFIDNCEESQIWQIQCHNAKNFAQSSQKQRAFLRESNSYPAGTRIVITEISPEDAFYDMRDQFIGKTATVGGGEWGNEIEMWDNGWWYGGVIVDDSPYGDTAFFEFKFTLLDSGTTSSNQPTASAFVGNWVNDDETGGMTRIIIDTDGSTMTIHGYGKCHPTDCDWEIVTASYTGNPFTAVYEFDFKIDTLTIELVSENSLHVHSKNVFHDGTNRDYEADYYFHRESSLNKFSLGNVAINNIQLSPSSPASLEIGQDVEISFDLTLQSPVCSYIWIKPLSHETEVGWSYGSYCENSGHITSGFHLTNSEDGVVKSSTIDALQFSMTDGESDESYHYIMPISYTYTVGSNTSDLPILDHLFTGGIAINGQAHLAQATLNLSDTVDVSGDIQVNAADVGTTAGIFVYAEATLPPATDKVYFMLGEGLTISVWDKNPANLVMFMPNVMLGALQSVPIYNGNFIYPGTLKVYFGYRLEDGTLVQNSQPIDIVINDGTTINTNLCTYDFESVDQLSFSEQTQYGETTVTTQVGCLWTASSDTDWITIVSGSEGNGTGTVTYAVAPNLGSDLKTGTVTIAGKTLTITVPTRPANLVSCSYEVSPISLSIPAAGDSGTINVVTQPGCDWAASSNAEWVKIEWITANHENGTGSVVYTADPNMADSSKTGTLTVAEQTVTVTISAKQVNSDTPSILTLPDLITYNFLGQETKTLPGVSTESGTAYNCNGTISDQDKIGRLAIVSLLYQNGCYTDGRYNHNDYLVERGIVSADTASQLQFESYRISEPTRKALEFLGSQHGIYYRFPTQEDYTVYRFDGNATNKILQVSASQIDVNQFVKVENLTVSSIRDSVVYIFAPSSQRMSTFTELAPNVEGARVNHNLLGDILKYRYTVNGKIFDTKLDFNYGPNTHQNIYSQTRQFFLVSRSDGRFGIVWQDKENDSIHVTWLGNELHSQETLELPFSVGMDLAVATSDERGIIYYLVIQQGSGIGQNGGTDIARMAELFKVDEAGTALNRTILDTSATGLNLVDFGESNIASLKYLDGKLGLILGRRMHRSDDGLNHQGAIAVVFNADTLSVDKNFGQTSGHSFESVLTTNSQGEFVGIDLGDNYPRGIHLHKFNQSQIRSRVVYTFKTEHGTSPTSPAGKNYPLYSEISGGTTYYQWSNDNRTYTELGGIIEANDGYTIVFAGESTPDGRALNNARVGDYLNDPRNIGLIQVRKDFENASSTGWNAITDDLVKTHGVTETGGFYTFGGSWSEQRNAGIVWLTHYHDKNQENVSRLKAVKLNDSNLLLLWEKWTPDNYVNTYAMKVDGLGNPLSEIVELGTQVRLDRRDDVWQMGNAIYFVTGDQNEGKLELTIFKLAR